MTSTVHANLESAFLSLDLCAKCFHTHHNIKMADKLEFSFVACYAMCQDNNILYNVRMQYLSAGNMHLNSKLKLAASLQFNFTIVVNEAW